MKIRILTIVQSVFIAIIFLLAWPFAVAIYGAEEESVKNNTCAVYLGVEDYGWISTENKDNFIHHFFVDGQQKSYKIADGKNNGYAIQNRLMEGSFYDLTIDRDMVINAVPSKVQAAGNVSTVTDQAIVVDGHEIKINESVRVYHSISQAGGAIVRAGTLADVTEGVQVKIYGEPVNVIALTFVAEEYEAPVKGTPGKRTLKNFLATAMEPVGTTLYVYGGAWNWQDDGSANPARSIGIQQSWIDFFQSQDQNYTYKNSSNPSGSYYPHGRWNQYYYAGMDCSGYVGWVVYNTMNCADGQEDKSYYVGYSYSRADALARAGFGFRTQNISLSDFKPGDVFSMKGHVWICLGTCEDGSMVILHSTPSGSKSGRPGGGVQLSAIGGSNGCQAMKLAVNYMKTYYPDWSERYYVSLIDYSTFINTGGRADTGKFSWAIGDAGLADPDGYMGMNAEQILRDLFP